MGTWNAIYLGNYSSIDPNEGNNTAENAGILVGETFGGPGDPILADETTIRTYDGGGAGGVLDNNNFGSYDWFRTNIGAGTQWYRFDAAATYNAEVTYVDGTVETVRVVIFQDTNGNTFLAPSLVPGDNAILNGAPLQSLELLSVDGATYTGLADNRTSDVFVACFVRGTIIDAADGPRYVETLKAGDQVKTLDDGVQPLIWTGGKVVDGSGHLAPIRFEVGAVGNVRPLLVSPQHRMLVTGWKAELHFGQDEVLVPAKALVNGTTICQTPMPRVSYHHILFESHQIVTAEGTASESFHPGKSILAQDEAIRTELTEIFPELVESGFEAPFDAARPCVKNQVGRLLAA